VSPGKVVLSWAESTDGARWAPARRGVPVSAYLVKRNGTTIAKVTTTSAQDHLSGSVVSAGGSITYQVQAIDASGNLSAPARTVVVLPAPTPPPPLYLSVGLVALAALAAGYALYRRWSARKLAMRDLPGPDPEDMPASSPHELTSDGIGRH
jgi:hypothetical protein